MKKANITTEVWRKLFPLKVGDKVRFLGLSRRWEVGQIINMYTQKEGTCRYFNIQTIRRNKVYHCHLTLIHGEIEIWRKRR